MSRLFVSFIIFSLFSPGGNAALAQEKSTLENRGKALLASNCRRCHSIEKTGPSSHPEAPPFRTLSRRYSIDALAEALAEGLSTGHPDMPEFVFDVQDVGAILAYLKSIQDSARTGAHSEH